jgi:putative ABC transport system permease protein
LIGGWKHSLQVEFAVKPYKLIKLTIVAASSLLQQKLRSILSVLGVVCGVMAVIAMISIGEGAKHETLRQIEQLGTRNIYIKAIPQTKDQIVSARERLSKGLTPTDLDRIKKGSYHIEAMAGLKEIRTGVLGVDSRLTPQVVACSDNYAELLKLSISSGRFIASQDLRYKNLVCVLGDDVARRLGDQGKIGQYLRMDTHLVKVVGILDPIATINDKDAPVSVRNYNEMIFVPLETAKTMERDGDGTNNGKINRQQLSEIIVKVTDTRKVMPTARLIKRILEVAHFHAQDYQIVVPLELLRQSQRTQRTLNLVLGTIAAISLLVGGIGIMNIMLATVSERTREIGIRRAVGATQRDILVQFLAEAVILTGAGGIIGLLIGLGTVGLFSTFCGWKMEISIWGVVVPLKLSFGVGIFFGLYPAKQASRVDPMVALRHE